MMLLSPLVYYFFVCHRHTEIHPARRWHRHLSRDIIDDRGRSGSILVCTRALQLRIFVIFVVLNKYVNGTNNPSSITAIMLLPKKRMVNPYP
jgi:hypothetical protein